MPEPLDIRRTLRSLVESAVLAPSSHNTQPWVFRLAASRLELVADRNRALPVNDPHDRELTISCGAAWFNVRVAAEHAGIRLAATLLPEREAPDLLARATPTAGEPERGLPSFAAIAARRTHRGDFVDRAVPAEVLDALRGAAAAEGAQLEVLAPDARAAAVALIVEGDRRQFADARWRRELAAWMHPRHTDDGLVVTAAPATRFVVRHADVGKGTANKDAKLAERSPVLAVLATEGDTPLDWLVAGQALERILMAACDAGLQASYLNQPIQVEALRPRVGELLAGGGMPQILLRLGYPASEPDAAPRRPVDAVIDAKPGR